MKKSSRKFKAIVILAAAVAVTSGCGGGGDGGAATPKSQAVGGGVDDTYAKDRYIALGKLLLRESYKTGSGAKETNALFGLDPEYTPESYFDGSPCYGKCWHTGVDYRAQSALNLYSPVDGVVVSSGASTSGEITIKDDKSGQFITFLHTSSREVAKDDRVQVGCLIGKSGNTSPYTMGYHLHIEMKSSQAILNWSYSKESLISAGAINPLKILDDYGFNYSDFSQGIKLPPTSVCAKSQQPNSTVVGVGGSTGGASSTVNGGTSSGGGTTIGASGNTQQNQTCIASNGQAYTSGQVETTTSMCQTGYQGSIITSKTCLPSSAERWITQTTNNCTPIPPSVSEIQFYNYNASTNKVFSGGFFNYNNAIVRVIGQNIPSTSVIEVSGLRCNISAPNTSAAYANQVGGISTTPINSTGIYETQFTYPSNSGISNGFMAVCDGSNVAGNVTYTARVKSRAGTSFEYIGAARSVFSSR
jgi:Peptidase family M23